MSYLCLFRNFWKPFLKYNNVEKYIFNKDGMENLIPSDHCLSYLGKACGAIW